METENMILRAVLKHCAATFRANRFALICNDATDYLALEEELDTALAWTKPDGAPASHVAAREAYRAWLANGGVS
jgi:hypothetical protein